MSLLRNFVLSSSLIGLTACQTTSFNRSLDSTGQFSDKISAAINQYESGETTNFGAKIINGERVLITDNPWQVALVVSYIADAYDGAFCGGSVIDDEWILTAAHCVDGGTQPSLVNVVYNSDNLKTASQRINVESIFIPVEYTSPSASGYDVALLKLKSSIQSGIIPLITQEQERALNVENVFDDNRDVNVRITGFGAIEEGGNMTSRLMGITAPYVLREICNDRISYDGAINETMFCAGWQEGGQDACQGDSGGPAVVSVNGREVLMGATSWGEGCAREFKYGVYARISSMRGWIDQTIASNP